MARSATLLEAMLAPVLGRCYIASRCFESPFPVHTLFYCQDDVCIAKTYSSLSQSVRAPSVLGNTFLNAGKQCFSSVIVHNKGSHHPLSTLI